MAHLDGTHLDGTSRWHASEWHTSRWHTSRWHISMAHISMAHLDGTHLNGTSRWHISMAHMSMAHLDGTHLDGWSMPKLCVPHANPHLVGSSLTRSMPEPGVLHANPHPIDVPTQTHQTHPRAAEEGDMFVLIASNDDGWAIEGSGIFRQYMVGRYTVRRGLVSSVRECENGSVPVHVCSSGIATADLDDCIWQSLSSETVRSASS